MPRCPTARLDDVSSQRECLAEKIPVCKDQHGLRASAVSGWQAVHGWTLYEHNVRIMDEGQDLTVSDCVLPGDGHTIALTSRMMTCLGTDWAIDLIQDR